MHATRFAQPSHPRLLRRTNVKKFCASGTVACVLPKLAFWAVAIPVESAALYPTTGLWPVINNVTTVRLCWRSHSLVPTSPGRVCRCDGGKRNPSTALYQRSIMSVSGSELAGVCSPEEVVSYWFSGTEEERTKRHWRGLEETDDEIRAKFAPTWMALSDPADDTLAKAWAAGGARSVLALIIVWDQFSRVLWRGDGRAFANDNRAGDLAMKTIQSGLAGAELSGQELLFVKMPLLHSESLEVHEWNAMQPGGDSHHVQGHLEVIQMFGRFPKRNAALGRESTPEEIEYMASPEAQGRPY